MGGLLDWAVRPIREDDAAEVARLHARFFSEYFLGHLGRDFLTCYYAQFSSRPGYGYVAERAGRIIGYVIGTPSTRLVNQRFYRRHFARLAWIVLCRCVADGYVRREVASRVIAPGLRRLWRSVRSLLLRRPVVSTPSVSTIPVRLLSIGVDPDFRGQGVADALSRHFNDALALDGYDEVGLAVMKRNARAIGFYERDGWKFEGETEHWAYFARPTREAYS